MRRIRTNIIGSTALIAGEMLSKGIYFFMLPYIVGHLSVEEFGSLELFRSSVLVLVPLFSLNSYASLVNHKFEFPTESRTFLRTIFILTSISSIIVGSTLRFFVRYLGISTLGLRNSHELSLLLLSSSSVAFAMIYLTSLQTEKKFFAYSFYNILKNLIPFISLYAFISFESRFFSTALTPYSLGVIIIGFLSLILILRKSSGFCDRKQMTYALRIGLPMLPHSLSGILNSFFDRLLIGNLFGLAEAGVYSFAYNIGMIQTLVNQSLNKVWVVDYFEQATSQKEKLSGELRKRAFGQFIIAGISSSLLIVSSGLIYKLTNASQYVEAIGVIPPIVTAYYFSMCNLTYSAKLSFSKKTELISLSTIITGLANVLLNVVLMPRFGYIVGAWTTLATMILHSLLTWVFSRRVAGPNIPLWYVLVGVPPLAIAWVYHSFSA